MSAPDDLTERALEILRDGQPRAQERLEALAKSVEQVSGGTAGDVQEPKKTNEGA